MRHVLVLLVVAIAACGQPATPSSSSCNLPISIADGHGNFQGAFISFPGGNVTSDPSGVGGQSFDRVLTRWLPVNHDSVSPDGNFYAYLDPKVAGTPGRARLHVVYVPTGMEKIVELGATGDNAAYVVVSYAPEGIWFSYAGYEGPSGGLFFLDSGTADWKEISGTTVLAPVAGAPGVFWFTDGGPTPEYSATGMGYFILSRLQRFSAEDGKAEEWFNEPGSYLRILGTDGVGHPIFTDGKDIRLALSPNETKVIGLPQGDYQLFADRRGVWFGGQTGIYLYSGGSVQKVSKHAGTPAGSCA